MSLRHYMMLLIFFLLALLPAHAVAEGQVTGSILYGSGLYRVEVDGDEAQKMTSQYGQAAISYAAKGMLGDARVGRYSLMLGYEFNIVDPTVIKYGVKDPAVERIDTGKVLYRGELLLAPGGLPFRLSTYARDVHRSTFSTEGASGGDIPLGVQPRESRSFGDPRVNLGINNGTHHELGVNLLLGIRNGSYLGSYRDVLSQLPRLMIDYKQVEVTDLSGDSNRQHYRARDLAFVSLNKKDNWVHFRLQEYTDFLDDAQDYNTTQVMIGTIDHILARQWINLTNWIKLSGDLSYTILKRQGIDDPQNTYNVNLFTVAKNREFNASILGSFERTNQKDEIKQEVVLPLYFYYEPNRESYYRGTLRGNFYRQSALAETSFASDSPETNRRDFTFDLGSELFRTRSIVFKPRITIGVNDNDSTQSISEKLILEGSNPRNKSSIPWTAGYSIAALQTSYDTTSTTYLEQSLYGNVEKTFSKALVGGLRLSVNHGSGDNDSDDRIGGVTNKVEIGAADSSVGDANRFWLYDGRVFLEYNPGRFLNRLELLAEGFKSDVDNLVSYEVRHELKVVRRLSSFTLISSLERGSEIPAQATSLEYSDNFSTGKYDFGCSTMGTYIYDPDRSLRFTLTGGGNRQSGDEKSNTTWLASEKLEYRFFKSNGIIRKIAEIYEEFGTESASRNVDRQRSSYLRLGATVYPTRYLYVKVASELVYFSPSGSDQISVKAESGVIFDKLQVVMNYGRGYKEAEGVLAEVREEQWDIKIKKTF